MQTAIVVNAYNRPQALSRLFGALQRAEYPIDVQVPLIISIDCGGSDEVRALAERLDWPYGPKSVILQTQHLGLLQHFYACGQLAERYESIVYLEDDLLVSPVFYAYAAQALSFYQHEDRIVGLSLYGLWFNGYTQQPFVPLADGSDAFFVQVPYTQGLTLTRTQWARFDAWRHSPAATLPPTASQHIAWSHFDADDWFPLFAKFVISTDSYFVYPRVSLTTGCGDAGTHFAQASRFFQVPLQHGQRQYNFTSLDDSVVVYDSFFEIQPDRLNRLTEQLCGYDYTVDLYAIKSPSNLRALHAKYVLTSRCCRQPLASFGKTMWPMEMNVIERVPGTEICLCRTEDVYWDRLSRLRQWQSNYLYFMRGRTPTLTTVLKLVLAQALRRIQLH